MHNKLLQINSSNIEKIIKYLIIGLIVICSIRYIPETVLKPTELIMIGSITSITYAIFDMVSPSISIYKTTESEKD